MRAPNQNLLPELATLTPSIQTVATLLADPRLQIPPYQRPYKWTTRNVAQLFDDIATFRDKQAYRLGTVVFHEERGRRNIVDGQQRTITLMLAVRVLIRERREKLDRKDLRDQLDTLAASMVDPTFTHSEAIANLHANHLELVRILTRSDFTEPMVDFLLNKCQVVTFALGDISEAFQFFDSQNARGRDLEPHDLLKAYHLREFDAADETAKAETVAHWERCQTGELSSLFAEYLYRIRNWSRGESARQFGKKDAVLFKGVHLDKVSRYPYVEQLRIAHHFVDHYNGHYERRIIGDRLAYPFQLDQTIINGRRFFEMIEHYRSKIEAIRKESHVPSDTPAPHRPEKQAGLEKQAAKIMRTIADYEGMQRDGDRYVRGIFDCLLVYYLDKFGDAENSRAIEKIFIWAYTLRMQKQVVQFASVDNYVLDTGIFQRIRNATDHREFLQMPLPPIQRNASRKTEAIQSLFQEMGYHE